MWRIEKYPGLHRLVDFNPETFTVFVDWHSRAKVFSKFIVIP